MTKAKLRTWWKQLRCSHGDKQGNWRYMKCMWCGKFWMATKEKR